MSSVIFRLTPDAALWQRVGDEVVVYGVERAEYRATNPAGTLLWPLLAEGASMSQLTGALHDRWGLPDSEARGDVEAFLAELRSHGLIEG